MRKILLLLFLLWNLSSPAFATDWCANANIFSCWTIEEGTGTSTADVSANTNDGTFKGAGEPAWSESVPSSGDGFDGESNSSISFDGSNDYVSCGTEDPSTQTLTLVSWIYWDGSKAQHRTIFSKRDTWSTTASRWQFGIQTDGKYKFLSATDNVSEYNISATSEEWEHVAITNNTTISYLYVNGVKVANMDELTFSNGTTSKNTIGSLYNGGIYAEFFDGDIDELAIFSSELDSTDINDIMDNGLVQASSFQTGITISGATMSGVTLN